MTSFLIGFAALAALSFGGAWIGDPGAPAIGHWQTTIIKGDSR